MMIFLQRVQEHLIASVQVGRWHSVPGGAGGAFHRQCAGMSAAGGTHHKCQEMQEGHFIASVQVCRQQVALITSARRCRRGISSQVSQVCRQENLGTPSSCIHAALTPQISVMPVLSMSFAEGRRSPAAPWNDDGVAQEAEGTTKGRQRVHRRH